MSRIFCNARCMECDTAQVCQQRCRLAEARDRLIQRERARRVDSAIHESPAPLPSMFVPTFDIELPPPRPWWERHPDLGFLARFCLWVNVFAFVAGLAVLYVRNH